MEDLEFLQNNSEASPAQNKLSPGSIVLILGIVAVAIVLGIQLFNRNQTQPTSGLAPDFELETYDDNTFRLSDHRGKVVFINFWGSWCAPCRDEAPDLQQLWEEYQDRNVMFIGVNRLDIENQALKFIDEFGLTYTNGNDVGDKITRSYRIQGMPESFVINQNGEIAEFIYGPVSFNRLRSILETLLAEDEA